MNASSHTQLTPYQIQSDNAEVICTCYAGAAES